MKNLKRLGAFTESAIQVDAGGGPGETSTSPRQRPSSDPPLCLSGWITRSNGVLRSGDALKFTDSDPDIRRDQYFLLHLGIYEDLDRFTVRNQTSLLSIGHFIFENKA